MPQTALEKERGPLITFEEINTVIMHSARKARTMGEFIMQYLKALEKHGRAMRILKRRVNAMTRVVRKANEGRLLDVSQVATVAREARTRSEQCAREIMKIASMAAYIHHILELRHDEWQTALEQLKQSVK